MVRIVFSDIDGTLLTDDKRVTEKTEQMGVTIPLICYSGALVLTKEGKTLSSTAMEFSQTQGFLKEAGERFPQATINYYAGHHWYVRDAKDPRVVFEMEITGAKAEQAEFAACLNKGILPHKILMMMEPDDCERAERELQELFPALNIVRSFPTLLEIMDKSVTKASGIEVLLQHYGLTAAESLSFGDNYNDLEMLQYTKKSVAMGNAPQKVKAEASDVTSSNEEDGIYAYLVKAGLIDA